jgi:hypothetical protein
MNGPVETIMENVFNAAYLITVWVLVALMAKGCARLSAVDRPLGAHFLLAFVLLAAGDTFHVGARLVTAVLGGSRATVMVGGVASSFIGLGMLATAYTVTVFYMVLAEARKLRSGRRADAAFWIMEVLLGVRLVVMALPGNNWESPVPPVGMGLVRNLPLAVAGVLMAILFIAEGRKGADRAWEGFGWAMIASYGFYTPVILFAARIPMLGLLMIPKTVAYVVMGIIAYRRYWRSFAAGGRQLLEASATARSTAARPAAAGGAALPSTTSTV